MNTVLGLMQRIYDDMTLRVISTVQSKSEGSDLPPRHLCYNKTATVYISLLLHYYYSTLRPLCKNLFIPGFLQ